jgi:hypothetical protein
MIVYPSLLLGGEMGSAIIHVIEEATQVMVFCWEGGAGPMLGRNQDRWTMSPSKIRSCRVGLHAAVAGNHAIMALLTEGSGGWETRLTQSPCCWLVSLQISSSPLLPQLGDGET